MTCIWIESLSTWTSNNPRTATFTGIVIKNLCVGASCWPIRANTFACHIVEFLIISACRSRFWAFTLTCIWIESLSSRASEYTGAATSAFVVVKYLSVWAAIWSIRTDTFACHIIKFLIISTCRSWFWAFTLTCIWIESLSTWTLNNPRTATFTGIIIKNLSVGASCWPIWANTFACHIVEFLNISACRSWFWTFTLTSLWIKFLSTWTCQYLWADTFAQFLIEYLSWIRASVWSISTLTLT